MLDTSETEKGRTHMQTIGFIGTGIMGASMARNLLKAGHEVFVYNRTREKAERLRPDGAAVCGSVGECAAGRDAVITVVGFPDDVREVYFGAGGILEAASPDTVLADMTTTPPSLAREIAQAAQARGLSSSSGTSSTKHAFFRFSGSTFPTAAEVGETCLKEVAALSPRASFSSFTSCQALNASRKLI